MTQVKSHCVTDGPTDRHKRLKLRFSQFQHEGDSNKGAARRGQQEGDLATKTSFKRFLKQVTIESKMELEGIVYCVKCCVKIGKGIA